MKNEKYNILAKEILQQKKNKILKRKREEKVPSKGSAV